mgnify:CR=1 FL=1
MTVVPKGASREDLIVCASAVPVAAENGQPLTRIRLLPAGAVKLKDSRGPYQCDPRTVVAAAKAYWGGEEMPLDYDHQTMATAMKGGQGGVAPASAWVKPANLTAEADGVYANDIEWTAAAAAAIQAKEYKYFSPLFAVSKTGQVTGLFGGSLTNDPAIGGLTSVAASRFHPKQEPEMDLAAIAAAVGLAATATEAEIIAAASAQASQLAQLRTTLGAKDGDTFETVVAAAAKKVAGAGDVIVPASAWQDAQTRLAALEGDKAVAAVDQAIKDGKIVPASRQPMVDWARRDLPKFQEYLATAPVIVGAGSVTSGQAPEGSAESKLTADELVAASALGMTAEQYLAGKE